MSFSFKFFSFFKRNPVRTLLTLLQLALGVAIAIVVINLTLNLHKIETQGLSEIGLDDDFGVFTIQRALSSPPPQTVYTSGSPRPQPTLRDLVAEDPSIKGITQLSFYDRQITVDSRSYVTIAYRGDHTFTEVFPLRMLHGSYISKDDEGKYVAVISESYAKLLFGRTNVVGEKIQTERYSAPSNYMPQVNHPETEFTVIGVFEDLPYLLRETVGKIHFIHTNEVDASTLIISPTIYIRSEKDRLSETHTLLTQKAKEIYDSTTSVNKTDLDLFKKIALQGFRELKQTLSLIAVAAIIVSSIGILSVMISSVTDKTVEIGIKRSLGATKNTIFADILKETAILTIVGAVIGVILAITLSPFVYREMILSVRTLQEFQISDFRLLPSSFILVVVTSLVLGLIFGMYPAKLASDIPPAEALRE